MRWQFYSFRRNSCYFWYDALEMESDFISDSKVKAVLFVSREVRVENLKRKFYLRQESKRILLSCYYIFFKGVAE